VEHFDGVLCTARLLRNAAYALHAFVVGAAAAFGDYPIDDLVGVGDVAGFAMDAVGSADFQF
jgi:hypothetical protein